MDLLTRFTNYLNSPQNKLSNKTVKNYKADITSFISWYNKQYNQELGVTPANITPQIVEDYKKSKIQNSNLSPSSLKRHLSSLRKFFQFLKTQGSILEDPFEQMKILQRNALLKDKWHLLAFKNYLYLYIHRFWDYSK
jgi:site-specific recombinase XerD